jgi:hypothetical protein
MRLLSVPYFQQHDNAGGQGWRECFSSSCAMLAAFYGKVRSDDEYNRARRRFGGTTIAAVQVQTLESLGLDATFLKTWRWEQLVTSIAAGHPVAVGYYHRGPVDDLEPDSHWGVCIGATADRIGLHDPWGEPRLASGGFVPGATGQGVLGSRRNFERRWSPEGVGHGWVITARVRGFAPR